MKKVILSFAIVLSSFFIFNFKVKALSEYSFDISFDNINEDFFKIKSLAEDYLTNSDYDIFVPEEPHKEEKQVLESFYILCIEKIKYLGEIFMSNYIYLTTLVVCILMFVFSLIFRRFLW